MEQFKEILEALKKLQDQQNQLITKMQSMTSEPPSGIVLSAFSFLFEGENNDYDKEYEDYISDSKIRVEELTIQERLSQLEAKIHGLINKQQDQDKLIDRLTALITTLEARMNLIQTN
ncbi:hypothetical protein [Brevibacillus porteri]|uniref:DUF5082 domain-containing protein n=1 Tax=Brevibacillus porteri TaxID=2126350 RepID=A0ABX5FHY0_9BACL|nr:hypothetical protein [Brevibacillus porteri]MED1801997.1 hypothetical protein [Brevibacillus porteri]MED2132558.1 hypothetical protein [Brevibacillus porteri]MED2745438.1 hypothetical protein [Brevibacillus porteri]MED2814285.1 hypothetical protein [Brevibacillus porteri]MED2892534.1 hypothetical protein [Brevibacillus porteri]